MGKSEEVLQILRNLARKNGSILSLDLIHRTLINEKILDSKKAIANCLRRLEIVRKIEPINFGVSIRLLEKLKEEEREEKIEYVQSSLSDLKSRWFNGQKI